MIPNEVCSSLNVDAATTRRVASGMSGGEVFRCGGDPTTAVKRWPSGTSVSRVGEIHRIISTAARHCELLPRYHGTWYRDRNGYIWDRCDWIDGRQIEDEAEGVRLCHGASAIADVHRALLVHVEQTAPSPAIEARLRRIGELSRLMPRIAGIEIPGRVHPTIAADVTLAASTLLGRWTCVASELSDRLAAVRRLPLRTQYVLRDVHREHVLFRGGEPVGIIDFDAVRLDSPLVDLARWASSFAAYRRAPDAVSDAVLAAYGEERPFYNGQTSTPPRTLLRLLADSGGWISLANWVVWTVLESRQFPDWERVGLRIRRLLQQSFGPGDVNEFRA